MEIAIIIVVSLVILGIIGKIKMTADYIKERKHLSVDQLTRISSQIAADLYANQSGITMYSYRKQYIDDGLLLERNGGLKEVAGLYYPKPTPASDSGYQAIEMKKTRCVYCGTTTFSGVGKCASCGAPLN